MRLCGQKTVTLSILYVNPLLIIIIIFNFKTVVVFVVLSY